MSPVKGAELVQQLQSEAEELQQGDTNALDTLLRRTEMVIRNVLGDQSQYLRDLDSISFHPSIASPRMPSDAYRGAWEDGKAALQNLLSTILEELVLFPRKRETGTPDEVSLDMTSEDSVFIVHGHDTEMKEAAARTVERLGLKAVVLHEQPNKGRTIIEKLMDYSSVASFAVVLLSPDDLAFMRGEEPSTAKPRARQNVILELGFFLGKLGRSRVIAVHREEAGFEMPTDYSGVVFTPFDERGTWKFELARELRAAGYDVDANELM